MALALILLSGTTILATFLLAGRRYVGFFALLVAVLFSQNLIAMVALRTGMVPISHGRLLLFPKEAVLVVAAVLAGGLAGTRLVQSRRIRASRSEVVVFVYLAFLAVQVFASDLPWTGRAAGLRAMALLPLLYLIARWLPIGLRHSRKMIHLMVGLAGAVAVFGLIEAYLLPPLFWLRIGHEEYYLVKVGRPIQNALYNNMRFWLPWSTEPIRRIASISGDPLISSYPLAYVLAIFGAFVVVLRRFNVAALLLATPILIALVLTLSRGAALSLALAIGLMLVFRRASAFRIGVVAGILTIVGAVVVIGEGLLHITYGAGHIIELQEGLMRGLQRPFGTGIGSAGSVAAGVINASSGGAGLVAGGDSYFGSVASQVGVVGLVLFVAALLSISTDLYRAGVVLLTSHPRLAVWYLATGAFIGGLLITSTVNESGMGYVASGPIFFLAGGLLNAFAEASRPARPAVPAGPPEVMTTA